MSKSHKGILNFTIHDKHALYNAYMPFVKGGGLFVPTSRAYKLGNEVFVLLQLLDEEEKQPVAGHVVWITPQGAESNRNPGIGIQLNDDEEGRAVRNRIESLLAGGLKSVRPTHTM